MRSIPDVVSRLGLTNSSIKVDGPKLDRVEDRGGAAAESESAAEPPNCGPHVLDLAP